MNWNQRMNLVFHSKSLKGTPRLVVGLVDDNVVSLKASKVDRIYFL